jgi:hypothetical protein
VKKSDIDDQLMLDAEQRRLCAELNRAAGNSLTMLEFATIALRAAGNNYAAVTDGPDSHARVAADLAHRRAAVLYVYEALKASEIEWIREWADLEAALDTLELLHFELP